MLAMCGTASFAADTLILKNGDRISGEIMRSAGESQNGSSVTFKSHYGAEMVIPLAQIMAIQSDDGEVLQSQVTNAEVIPEAPVEAAEEVASTEPAAGDPTDPKKYVWSGRVNLGASLDDGNNQKKAVTGDFEVKARNAKNRWITGGEANFANDEGEETENDQSIFGEYNRFVSEKWFVGARQDFEVDKIALLDLRSKTGAFAGYQFYEQEDLNLKVRFGPNYIYEDFENGDTEEDIAMAWGLNYDQTFWDDAFTLFHDHSIDAPFDPIDAFIFESSTGIRVPVAKNLTGTAQVDFDWDNDPAAGVREEDTSYSLKLGYEW